MIKGLQKIKSIDEMNSIVTNVRIHDSREEIAKVLEVPGAVLFNPSLNDFNALYNYVINLNKVCIYDRNVLGNVIVKPKVTLVIDSKGVGIYTTRKLNDIIKFSQELNISLIVCGEEYDRVEAEVSRLPELNTENGCLEEHPVFKTKWTDKELLKYLPKGNVHFVEGKYHLEMIKRFILGSKDAIACANEYGIREPEFKRMHVILDVQDMNDFPEEWLNILINEGRYYGIKTIIMY